MLYSQLQCTFFCFPLLFPSPMYIVNYPRSRYYIRAILFQPCALSLTFYYCDIVFIFNYRSFCNLSSFCNNILKKTRIRACIFQKLMLELLNISLFPCAVTVKQKMEAVYNLIIVHTIIISCHQDRIFTLMYKQRNAEVTKVRCCVTCNAVLGNFLCKAALFISF